MEEQDTNIQTTVPDSADDTTDSPVNPWTETFVLLAKYLIRDYSDKVRVSPQFELFQKPMRIDAVIVIQEDGLVIDNALMRSFKRHNIIEFKSPNDTLNIQAFDKTLSYFYAYLSNERKNDTSPITADDVTLTLISVRKPEKAIKILQEERNFKILDTETPGIYYIIKDGFIPEKIQLVVSSELPDGVNDQSLVWLKSLRNNLTPKEVSNALNRARKAVNDDASIQDIIDFILSVNPDVLEEVEKMERDPRVDKFYEHMAIKTGVAQKFAEERARAAAREMLMDGISIEKVAKYNKLDEADVAMIASSLA